MKKKESTTTGTTIRTAARTTTMTGPAPKTARQIVSQPPIHYNNGMAKIHFPGGFSTHPGIGGDPTGRGPAWDTGTEIGDLLLPSPIKQCVRGIGGIYEFTFLDQPPITASQFRTKADEYLKSQLGIDPPSTAAVSSSEQGQERQGQSEEQSQVQEQEGQQNQAPQTPSTSTSSEEKEEEDQDQENEQQQQQQEQSVEMLERKFWRRLGPTMHPAMYGADMEGSLFSNEGQHHGWHISKLSSCLQLLLSDQNMTSDDEYDGIPGVTTPYLYFGMWASVFCAHTEDMNLLSINYLHAGAPKVWYAIAAGEDSQRFEQFVEGHYHQSKTICPEYLRHKRCLVSPKILKKAGIPFTTAVQYPGEAMITFPGSYHFGFNTGFNVAEATNFAVPEWVPYGKLANVCLCRPDSVRIDMNRFERLLLQYEAKVKQWKRLPWKEWAIRLRNKRIAQEQAETAKYNELVSSSTAATGGSGSTDETKENKPKRRVFWVEVMQPVGARSTTSKSSSSSSSTSTKKKKSKKEQRKRKQGSGGGTGGSTANDEVWHLAKPGGRKSLRPPARVLCIMPAAVDLDQVDKYNSSRSRRRGNNDSFLSDDEIEEDEQCFAGVISEVRDDYVRVHLDGLARKDDVWMSIDSPKLFLDGGRWGDGNVSKSQESLPPLHYWREEDSKRRCV